MNSSEGSLKQMVNTDVLLWPLEIRAPAYQIWKRASFRI